MGDNVGFDFMCDTSNHRSVMPWKSPSPYEKIHRIELTYGSSMPVASPMSEPLSVSEGG